MNLSQREHTVWAAAGLLTLVGCGGEPTPSRAPQSDAAFSTSDAAHCFAEVEPLADWGEVPEQLGFSAAEVAALAILDSSSSISWLADSGVNWAGADSVEALSYSLTLADAPARLLLPGAHGTCVPTLEMDAQLTLSVGGSLSLDVPATLKATSPGFAVVSAELAFTEVEGALSAAVPSERQIDRITIEAYLSSGSFAGVVTAELMDESSATFSQLGRWPDDECAGTLGLEVGVSQAVERGTRFAGVSVDSALAAISKSSSVGLQWDDGSTTQLSFSAAEAGDAGTVCGILALGRPAVLHYPANVELRTADGRINGSYEVAVSAQGAPVSATMSLTLRELAPQDFAAATGLADLPVEQFDKLDFLLENTIDGASRAQRGFLEARGYPTAGCGGAEVIDENGVVDEAPCTPEEDGVLARAQW